MELAMALPFFKALNPAAKESGIYFDNTQLAFEKPLEIIDRSLTENIDASFRKAYSLFLALRGTFHVLTGTHYDLHFDENSPHYNAKGLLDFTILPLISRKLIADTYSYEQQDQTYLNILSWCIALPLEIFRFTAALAITLVLSPLIAIGTMIRCCFEPSDSLKTSEGYVLY